MVWFFVGLALAAPPEAEAETAAPAPPQAARLMKEGRAVLEDAQQTVGPSTRLKCPPGASKVDVHTVEVSEGGHGWMEEVDCATDPESCEEMAALYRPDRRPRVCGQQLEAGTGGRMCAVHFRGEGPFVVTGPGDRLVRGACRADKPHGEWITTQGGRVRAVTRWEDGKKHGISLEPCCDNRPLPREWVRYVDGKETERVSVSMAFTLLQYRRPDGYLWHVTQGERKPR